MGKRLQARDEWDVEVGRGGGGEVANTEQVKMNTIWVHEREAGEGGGGAREQNKSTSAASM